MKKTLMLLFGLLMFTGVGFAQNAPELKGPKAKNAKPWKHNQNKTKIQLVQPQQDRTVGPRAKNTEVKPEESQIVISQEMMAPSKRIGTSGPTAKNYKHGKN